MFDPPEGQAPYDYVFDFTGEVQYDRTEMVPANIGFGVVGRAYFVPQIQIDRTCKVARMIGLESAKRKVKSHIRLQHAFYETPSKGSHDEKEDVKPDGVVGIWWHETLRMLAAIEESVVLSSLLYFINAIVASTWSS
jgi:hypothetical protein